MLYAKGPRLPFPGCTVPANLCEAHHCNPYATNPVTEINDLTLAAATQPRQLADQGWTTRKNATATPNWIPPAHLDHGQRADVNGSTITPRSC